jgi:hypothetical protein
MSVKKLKTTFYYDSAARKIVYLIVDTFPVSPAGNGTFVSSSAQSTRPAHRLKRRNKTDKCKHCCGMNSKVYTVVLVHTVPSCSKYTAEQLLVHVQLGSSATVHVRLKLISTTLKLGLGYGEGVSNWLPGNDARVQLQMDAATTDGGYNWLRLQLQGAGSICRG